MPTVAAPVITWEMNNWIALGGGNSGIIGNDDHDSGFHVGARYLPADDYSRRRDPNGSDGPYVDWDYACAGDFSHRNIEKLRVHHRRVLNGLMNGEYPMICEFIGKPWSDRPVYYWARWNGIKTLQRYTGVGHDHWSHISWYRSRVNRKANLWTPQEDDMTKEEFTEFLEYAMSRANIKNPETDNDASLAQRVLGIQTNASALRGEMAGLTSVVKQFLASNTDLTEAEITAAVEAGVRKVINVEQLATQLADKLGGDVNRELLAAALRELLETPANG
jgi:hypothetical protein